MAKVNIIEGMIRWAQGVGLLSEPEPVITDPWADIREEILSFGFDGKPLSDGDIAYLRWVKERRATAAQGRQ